MILGVGSTGERDVTLAAVEDLVQGFMFGPYPDDPYPSYDALRDAAPVHRCEQGLWLVASYETCTMVLRDPRFGQGVGATRLHNDDRFAESPAFRTLAHMLPFIDPPDHTRLRKLISRAFTPRAVERMRSYLSDYTDDLFGAVRAKNREKPVTVPPVPTPHTTASSFWSICSQISGAVVSSCARGFASLPN